MKIGFIGAGKVGFTLGKYGSAKGVPVAGYYSRGERSAQEAAAFTASRAFAEPEALAAACDVLFLTVPDGQIGGVWRALRALPLQGKSVVHCSGSLSSDVFEGIAGTGACGYSLHPLFAVHDRQTSWKAMDGVYFTLEGKGGAGPDIRALLDALGNPWSAIAPEDKTRYHAACVAVSNLVVGLARLGEEQFARCGLDGEFARGAWRALFRGSAGAILEAGIPAALTGPVERGDADTVRGHLCALDGEALAAYRSLSRVLLGVAREKHPGRDYAGVEKELFS